MEVDRPGHADPGAHAGRSTPSSASTSRTSVERGGEHDLGSLADVAGARARVRSTASRPSVTPTDMPVAPIEMPTKRMSGTGRPGSSDARRARRRGRPPEPARARPAGPPRPRSSCARPRGGRPAGPWTADPRRGAGREAGPAWGSRPDLPGNDARGEVSHGCPQAVAGPFRCCRWRGMIGGVSRTRATLTALTLIPTLLVAGRSDDDPKPKFEPPPSEAPSSASTSPTAGRRPSQKNRREWVEAQNSAHTGDTYGRWGHSATDPAGRASGLIEPITRV